MKSALDRNPAYCFPTLIFTRKKKSRRVVLKRQNLAYDIRGHIYDPGKSYQNNLFLKYERSATACKICLKHNYTDQFLLVCIMIITAIQAENFKTTKQTLQ